MEDSATLPDESVARTCRVWRPSCNGLVSHDLENGANVLEPRSVPSARMATCATPPASVAFATTGTTPATIAPSAGDATDACGPVVSGGRLIGYSARIPRWSE